MQHADRASADGRTSWRELSPRWEDGRRHVHRAQGGGEIAGKATAELRGLELVRATASLRVPKQHAVDLVADGRSLGALSGEARLGLSPGSVEFDVPYASLKLAQVLPGGVQPLEKRREDFHVGVFRETGDFVALTRDRSDVQPERSESRNGGPKPRRDRVATATRVGRRDLGRRPRDGTRIEAPSGSTALPARPGM
jgi:hypothetical protein